MLKPLPSSQWNRSTAAHLLNRAGFGGTPAQIEALAKLGLEGAVDRLIRWEDQAESFPPPEWTKVDPETRAETFRKFRNGTPEERQAAQREMMKERRQHLLELQGWWLHRMFTTPRPLQEKLTLFWHGHFATAIEKVRDPILMWRQNETLRHHAGGDWLTLLDEVTRDPAMLIYLDQHQSRPQNPNENYARELLELFALGEGHYTEQDVMEAARALTGLTLDRLKLRAEYDLNRHDTRRKTFMGNTGNLDGWDILDTVAHHPQSARFISAKLWAYFAAENPSPDWIDALSHTFVSSERKVQPFLRAIFLSEEFYSPGVLRRQIKSPVQFLVQACRQLERELPPTPLAMNALRLLGQVLFAPPNVKGWDGGVAWINTNTLLHRHNLALLLVTGENALPIADRGKRALPKRAGRSRHRLVKGVVETERLIPLEDRRDAERVVSRIEDRLMATHFRVQDRTALLDHARTQAPLDDAEAATLLRLAMCTADYQLC